MPFLRPLCAYIGLQTLPKITGKEEAYTEQWLRKKTEQKKATPSVARENMRITQEKNTESTFQNAPDKNISTIKLYSELGQPDFVSVYKFHHQINQIREGAV